MSESPEEKELKRRRKFLKREMQKLGHIPREKSTFMSNQVICSCGWECIPFWDGACFAWDRWYAHAGTVLETHQIHLDFGDADEQSSLQDNPVRV